MIPGIISVMRKPATQADLIVLFEAGTDFEYNVTDDIFSTGSDIAYPAVSAFFSVDSITGYPYVIGGFDVTSVADTDELFAKIHVTSNTLEPATVYPTIGIQIGSID